jgi:hypothetical protein
MANDLIVRILGDTKGLEKSFAKANQATATFGRNVESTGKQADIAAKRVSGFAKGAAAGFGGAIAFNAGLNALRSVIGAATESEQAIVQTNVALENAGKSWAEYGKQIEKAIQEQSKLGFDDEALLRTFSQFVRTTGEVTEALRLNNIAMDVARQRGTDLEQAATLVNKAALGQAGALRRLGIDTEGVTDKVELLALLERKFAGAAEAASNSAVGAQDRFKVSVENAEEALGTVLLPTITRLADQLAAATEAGITLGKALGALGRIKVPPILIRLRLVDDSGRLGSLLGKAKDAFMQGAETQFPGLAFVNELMKLLEEPPPPPDTAGAAKAFDSYFDSFLESLEGDLDKSVDRANNKLKSFGEKGFKALEVNELGATLKRQFDSALEALSLVFDRAEFSGNDRAALAALDKTEALIRKRIQAQGHTNELERQLFDVERQRAAILDNQKAQAKENAAKAKDLARETKEAAREAARAAREAQQALTQRRQFLALGLSPEGNKPTPTVGNLEKQLGQLLGRDDLTKSARQRLKSIGRVLAGAIGDVKEPTRAAIRDLFQTIRDEFDKGGKQGGPLTKTTGLNTKKILEGLGLTPEAERELRQRLSGFNSAGIANAGNRPTGGGFVGGQQPVVVNTTVVLDGEKVGRSTTRHQQKDKRRNPKAKRGPRSGI